MKFSRNVFDEAKKNPSISLWSQKLLALRILDQQKGSKTSRRDCEKQASENLKGN
jgi:hypothetical protein